ncbi:MAG: NAD(P)-dependent oxidoreductase, partial [Comamonadaceae bacterium]
MNIAVLGTGLMGFPMARRLCESDHTVRVWNRSRAKAEHLGAFGATVHDTPAAAVRGASIVICMLESGPVVEDVLFHQGAAPAMNRGTLVIEAMSIT